MKKQQITSRWLRAMFTYWATEVFSGAGLTPVEQVDVFLKCLFGTDVYLHPNRKTLVVGGKEIPVNVTLYKSFFSHFSQGYKPSEIEAFYAQKDRLVEDTARRMQGAFFTPQLWVDEAHKMVTEVLGSNWKDECIVWDPAAGTANLTRDYGFKDLIVSTLEPSDMAVIKTQGWHPGASVFTYDFLNDDASPFFEEKNVIPESVDKQLRAAAQASKRIVFLMNPPYGTSGVAGANGTSKAGIANTAVNQEMKQAKLGASSQQLYAQFMFRCNRIAQNYGFTKQTVAMFSKPTFMCSGSYRKLRDWWYGQYSYQAGMLFQASHFADVSGKWGISFTIWSEGKTKRATAVQLKNIKNSEVVNIGDKEFYHADGRETTHWIRQETKGIKTYDAPQMMSGLKVKSTGDFKCVPGFIGYLTSKGNSICDNSEGVYLTSSCGTRGGGLSIIPANFLKVNALYAARKLIQGTWATDKDEYLAPDPTIESSDAYKRWNADAVVYAIIDTKNNCTAMRDVKYKGKLWRLKNNFWWKTLAESRDLYDTPETPVLYADIKAETQDSYLATILPSLKPLMSQQALKCLEILQDLTVKSLPYRENYASEHPDLQLTCHDAGIYQLKHLFRDLFPEKWKTLQAAHKILADSLRPGVYDLGWLKNR